jgi:hypothetical protein
LAKPPFSLIRAKARELDNKQLLLHKNNSSRLPQIPHSRISLTSHGEKTNFTRVKPPQLFVDWPSSGSACSLQICISARTTSNALIGWLVNYWHLQPHFLLFYSTLFPHPLRTHLPPLHNSAALVATWPRLFFRRWAHQAVSMRLSRKPPARYVPSPMHFAAVYARRKDTVLVNVSL